MWIVYLTNPNIDGVQFCGKPTRSKVQPRSSMVKTPYLFTDYSQAERATRHFVSRWLNGRLWTRRIVGVRR